MVISYDGTRYRGWQIQPNALSIQSLIQGSLKTVLRTSTPITASGRTDAGVHALAQVAHFEGSSALNSSSLLYSLNGILPPDIRIRELTPTHDHFHARFSSKLKIYHYHLHLAPVQDPFRYLYSAHIRAPLNLDLISQALPHFTGTHDFSTFASSGCFSKNSTKTLYRLQMIPEIDGIRFEFEGDGFLYKMVRNIVGTLIEVGQKKRFPTSIPNLIAEKDRRQAGPTANPKGLFLYAVRY